MLLSKESFIFGNPGKTSGHLRSYSSTVCGMTNQPIRVRVQHQVYLDNSIRVIL